MPTYNYFKYYNDANNMISWAQNTLSNEELTRFLNDLEENHQGWNTYFESNLVSIEKLYEDIFVPELNELIHVAVGEKLTLQPGVNPSVLQMSPNWAYWVDRYNSENHTTEVVELQII